MSVDSFSLFYFLDDDIDTTNQNLNFNEGGGELLAVLEAGSYSPGDLTTVVKTAMDAAGSLVYTVTFDRTLRKYVIAATGTFSLLISSGSQFGTSPFSLMGFTGADVSGSTSYTSNVNAGSKYEPQFKLQNFVDKDDSQQKINATVNESANGDIEVVAFGIRSVFEMSIRFATDRDLTKSGFIRNNPTGVADLRVFMQRITDKAPFEFIPDIGVKTQFTKVLLDSTPESPKGTAYKLKELSMRGGPVGFFDTGLLKMRVVV